LASGIEAGLPGIALHVEQDGKSLFSGAAGVASIEEETALKPADKMRIYSIGKTFTAIVVLQLVDEGGLSLDDSVTSRLTDPVVARIPNVDRITLRQLLNHTSGIYDFGDESDSPFYQDAFLGPDADWTKVWTPQELLAYADGAEHDPYSAPGEGWHYASTNYILLGLVVEAATKHPFGDELRDRILEPLNLEATSLEIGKALPDDVVDGYQVIEGELVNVSAINLSWDWTAGGMVSTTADLARFARAAFGGELLSPESFKEMFTFVSMGRPGLDGGMGVYRVQTPNGELVGMDGGGAGGTSTMMRQADEDVTVVALVNMAPDEGATDQIRDEAVKAALKPA
jgi:CubicO group peptidase (beta-lactamase class C family)